MSLTEVRGRGSGLVRVQYVTLHGNTEESPVRLNSQMPVGTLTPLPKQKDVHCATVNPQIQPIYLPSQQPITVLGSGEYLVYSEGYNCWKCEVLT